MCSGPEGKTPHLESRICFRPKNSSPVYNREAPLREFAPGNKVLVLLSISLLNYLPKFRALWGQMTGWRRWLRSCKWIGATLYKYTASIPLNQEKSGGSCSFKDGGFSEKIAITIGFYRQMLSLVRPFLVFPKTTRCCVANWCIIKDLKILNLHREIRLTGWGNAEVPHWSSPVVLVVWYKGSHLGHRQVHLQNDKTAM